MIIFDLDGTLADCSHRQHFIEAPENSCGLCYDWLMEPNSIKDPLHTCLCGRQPGIWRLDWKSFQEACDKDIPIEPVITIFSDLSKFEPVLIWTGRCESVRDKTVKWFYDKWFIGLPYPPLNSWINQSLKMRPIGDFTPEHKLKEQWLDEYFYSGSDSCPLRWATHDKCCKKVDYVFDSDPDSIAMWRKRGIFVFDVSQGKGEF